MDAIHHLLNNWDDVLTGATVFGIVAHLVNTFPVPKNEYGRWFIGGIQYIVGQRMAGQNTVRGNTSEVISLGKQ